MRALAILLLLGAQDADKLVRQLGDEEIEVRERAGQELLEMGAAARKALEKAAKESDPEVAGRARSILGEIALAEGRKRVFGKVGRLTFPEAEYTLETISTLVRDQAEVAIALPKELAGERVKIGSKEELLWPFVDRLCRAHGGLRLMEEQPGEAIGLEKGPPGAPPVYVSGPFRVWVERIRLERRDPFDGGWERGTLVLDVAWPPNVRPLGTVQPAKVAIREIVGEDGKALALDPALRELYPSSMSWGARPRTHREFVRFEHPARGVRRLSKIRGSAQIVFPQRIETIMIERPAEAVGKPVVAGAYTVTLQEFKAEGEGWKAIVKIESPKAVRQAPLSPLRAGLYDRWVGHDLKLADAKGRETRGRTGLGRSTSSSSSDGMSWESLETEFFFPAMQFPASLRLEFITEYFEKVVDFEFKDVELP